MRALDSRSRLAIVRLGWGAGLCVVGLVVAAGCSGGLHAKAPGTGGSPGSGGATGLGGLVGTLPTVPADGSAGSGGTAGTSFAADSAVGGTGGWAGNGGGATSPGGSLGTGGKPFNCYLADGSCAPGCYNLDPCFGDCSRPNCVPIRPAARCGNGMREPGEACDDGNTASGDGCSGDHCTIEAGYHCPASGQRCVPICGDSMLKGTENCDDGNSRSGDGCSSNCLTEPGWDCSTGVCVRISSGDGGPAGDGGYLTCGDGIISGAEECDDGPRNLAVINITPDYGRCLLDCKRGPFCGDGLINGSEECDQGANDGTYGACNPDCTLAPRCGDGVVQADYGEECESASADDPDCIDCRFAGGCGDGVIKPPERCDDGALFNDGHYGGCAPSCILAPHCGDGIKNGPEECDDGILDGSYGGCTPGCKLAAYCGDGILNGPEQCDHGVDNGKDGMCTMACKTILWPPP